MRCFLAGISMFPKWTDTDRSMTDKKRYENDVRLLPLVDIMRAAFNGSPRSEATSCQK
jgi:hypothetical protein